MKMNPMVMMGMMAVLTIASLVFAYQGVRMHAEVDSEEARLHSLQADYFSIAKADRDAAPAGSDLNARLVEISQLPSELLRLKLVGVGKILTGIYVLLFGILVALIMMPVRLGRLLNKQR
ncbi:hypothetical protein HYX10_04915 [Candidatus Woesearchaeota archaeon]|nr:hypothetical protein [Candidatus Woesearchaeota archaeon]